MSMSPIPSAGRLAELEQVIERGLSTFVDVGNALLEIRESRLYLDMDETFEGYCRLRWTAIPGITLNSRQRIHQVMQAAQVSRIFDEGGPVRESHAAELAPLLDEPAQLREAWAEVVDLHPKPTAAQVREVVARHIEPQTEAERKAAAEKLHRWATTQNVLDGLQHFDRPAIREQAETTARLIDPAVAASRGEVVTAERLRSAAAWAALLADVLERTIDA